MLEADDTVRHVELVVAAAGRVDDHHDRNALKVLVTDQARALVGVVRVQLDQVRAISQLALDLVVQLPYQILVVVAAASVSLHCHIRKMFMNIILLLDINLIENIIQLK